MTVVSTRSTKNHHGVFILLHSTELVQLTDPKQTAVSCSCRWIVCCCLEGGFDLTSLRSVWLLGRIIRFTVIGQAEIFPTLIARLTWKDRLKNRRVLYFIDNEAARLGLVKSYSPVLPSLDIIMACIGWDYQQRSTPWYARVPTACNLADGPSRMSVDTIPRRLKCVIVPPIFPEGFSPLEVLK